MSREETSSVFTEEMSFVATVPLTCPSVSIPRSTRACSKLGSGIEVSWPAARNDIREQANRVPKECNLLIKHVLRG